MNCIDMAIKAANGRLTNDEINAIVERADQIKLGLRDRGISDNLDGRALTIAMRESTEKKIEAARLRRQVAQNIKARSGLDEQVNAFLGSGMKPVDALKSLHEGTQKPVKGARASSYAQGQAYEAHWIGSLFATLQREKPYLLKMLGNHNFDNAVTKELWELREGGTPGSTGNKDAQYLAGQLASYTELSRTELNRLGAAIGKLDGYAGPQVHDDLAMLKAGREKWVGDIYDMLDQSRTFPDATSEAEAKGILANIYDTIITGMHKDEITPLMKGQRVGPANLASGLGKHRVLHFRDAETAMAYRDTYGRGSTIQGMIGQLRHHAQYAGVMDKFGPNPKAMMLSLAERIKSDLRKEAASITDPKKLAAITKQIDSLSSANGEIARLTSVIDDMTGLNRRPVSISMANISQSIRNVQSMAKLGGATITSMPSDTMTMIGSAATRGQGWLGGTVRALGEFANRKDGKEIGYLLGEGFDGLQGHIANAAAAHDGVPGSLSKWMHNFFWASGLSGWTDTARAAAARMISAHLGFNAGKTFDKLDPALNHVLNLNGIDAAKWEAIRQTKTRLVNGHDYITPDAIRHLPDEVIEPTVVGKIADARKALKNKDKFEAKRQQIIKDARHDLEMDLHRYFADETSYGVVEEDAKARRIKTGGFRPGTVAGEAMRFIMQFKGFPIAFADRVLGRMIRNAPQGRGVQAVNIGTMLAGLTVAGYMAMTVKDMARGLWPPRDPRSVATWTASLLQGGALGIYGDFLFGQKSRFDQSMWATLGGPSVGNAEDLYTLYQQARAGQPSATKALDVAINNTPFINLFYTRTALDILFLNAMRESLNPGYLARQAQMLKDTRGQHFMVPRTLGQAFPAH